jgi:selT/selW/selH-like putative selenoprotein
LAAELKQRYDVEARLKPGHKGVFDVLVDGELIFSKHETHRFPRPNEVGDAIDAAQH